MIGPDDGVARAAALLGRLAQRDVPLGRLTTYRVGGPAALFVEASSVDDLWRVAEAVAASDLPTLVVGKGSNLLVADAGFPGVAVILGAAFTELAVDGTDVEAGGAVALPVAARRTVRWGLTGFEWAVGVPGSVGGAVRMNAGGHGSDMAASLIDARIVDLGRRGSDTIIPAADLELGYRRSAIAPQHVVVAATLELRPGDRAAGEREIADIVAWRRANQPGGQNAGSVFTNPPADSAGRLIDAAGCKGLRLGSAEVSSKHANFFQADAGGSADDVRALMEVVRHRVREHSGVDLHPETRLVGFDNPQPRVESQVEVDG
jgi:UDP-N-acetylmuramate dehydrogenase